MKYIDIINNFWLVNDEHSFQPTAVALYFYLLKINNRCYWRESFKHNNKKIEATLDISYKSLSNARNQLKQAGLIKFKTQNGNPNTTYSLTFVKKDEVREEVREEVRDEVRDEVHNLCNKRRGQGRGTDEVRDEVRTRSGHTKERQDKIKTKTLKERKEEFRVRVLKFKDKHPPEILKKFFLYWSEENFEKQKMLWEMREVFNLKTRLDNWVIREKKYKNREEKQAFHTNRPPAE